MKKSYTPRVTLETTEKKLHDFLEMNWPIFDHMLIFASIAYGHFYRRHKHESVFLSQSHSLFLCPPSAALVAVHRETD